MDGRCRSVADAPDLGTPDFGPPDDFGADLAGDADMDAGPPVLRRGAVVAKSQSVEVAGGEPRASSEITAEFAEVVGEERCVRRTVGDCSVAACVFVPAPVDADMGIADLGAGEMGGGEMGGGEMGAEPAPNAGFITVAALATYGLMPAADGTYDPVRNNEPLWDGSRDVAVEAEGASVPRFTLSIPPPPQLRLIEPPRFAALTLDPGADLPLRWTPVEGSVLRVAFTLPPAEEDGTPSEVTCLYESARGEGVIGAEVFRDASLGVDFEVSVESSSGRLEALPGGWEVVVAARSDVRAVDAESVASGAARLDRPTEAAR